MIIKMRYENEVQELNIDIDEASKWVNIQVEPNETKESFEKRIQNEVDEQYNKPEYNIYHRETRHIDPTPKRKRMDGKKGYICSDEDDESFDIFDYIKSFDPTQDYMDKFEYEEVCKRIRGALKPKLADIVIAIALDRREAREIATDIVDGSSLTDSEYEELLTKEANKISKKYRRALKNLEKLF